MKFSEDGVDKSGFHELSRYYQKPIDIDHDLLQAKFYLSDGKDEFKVDDIEVFKVSSYIQEYSLTTSQMSLKKS